MCSLSSSLGPCIQQPIAPFPAVRCFRNQAFEVVGIDFAGPLYIRPVKSSNMTVKVYICLITCAVTRDLYLELVSSLLTHCFIMALRRFISQRGICRIFYSDNAKTFKAADEELQQLWKNLRYPEMRAFFRDKGIEWRFVCEQAPWWGGFYEALVKSVKTPLKKVLGLLDMSLLQHDELETPLKEGEAMLNSRPFTYVYNDLRELDPLTPSHIIIGRWINLLPPITSSATQEKDEPPEQQVKRARYREKLFNSYWQSRSGKYFHQLSNSSSKAPS